jgi:hypothetical protein
MPTATLPNPLPTADPQAALMKALLDDIKAQGQAALAADTGFTGLNVNGQPVVEANPLPTIRAQRTVEFASITAAAGVSASLFIADGGRRGGRILNPLSSPIWITKASSGDPPQGAGSEFVPAAFNGEPGQFTFDYRPTDEFRYITAGSGGFTVITW